jgi:hypothetical protein
MSRYTAEDIASCRKRLMEIAACWPHVRVTWTDEEIVEHLDKWKSISATLLQLAKATSRTVDECIYEILRNAEGLKDECDRWYAKHDARVYRELVRSLDPKATGEGK